MLNIFNYIKCELIDWRSIMLEIILILWTYFTVFVLIGGTIVLISRTISSIAQKQSIDFKNLEFLVYVVSMTYWIIKVNGI